MCSDETVFFFYFFIIATFVSTSTSTTIMTKCSMLQMVVLIQSSSIFSVKSWERFTLFRNHILRSLPLRVVLIWTLLKFTPYYWMNGSIHSERTNLGYEILTCLLVLVPLAQQVVWGSYTIDSMQITANGSVSFIWTIAVRMTQFEKKIRNLQGSVGT